MGRLCAVSCALLALLPLISAPALHAQTSDTIYRCTDGKGALTIQNGTPCPKGSKQTTQVIEAPTVVPAYVPPPPIVTQVPKDDTPAEPVAPPPTRPEIPKPAKLADEDRLPPPPIFQCETWENLTYLSENFEPKPRCVKLQTTGLSGDANNGAGAACEMKYDMCWRVPDQTACDGWKQRQREIESTWRYAPGEEKQRLQEEFARVTTILNDTTCGSQQR